MGSFGRFAKHILAIHTLIIYLMFSTFIANITYACTRILDINGQGIIVGRTFDWAQNIPVTLWVYPAGIQRNGLAEKNPIRWVSKYGSIVMTPHEDSIVGEGMNEQGLAAHVLWLNDENYGLRNESIPGLSVSLWVQYYLDNFQTVSEAVQFTASMPLQILPYRYARFSKWLKLHLALEDARGDSAIIEYVNGKLHIYHNKTYTVLTNDPTFDMQLKNLGNYTGFGGSLALPGTTNSSDRFVRASYYNKFFSTPSSIEEEIFQMFSLLHNIAEPYNSKTIHDVPTRWTMISDLTNKVYYITAITSMNTLWVNLSDFDLKTGGPIMKLRMPNPTLVGDVSKKFVAAFG